MQLKLKVYKIYKGEFTFYNNFLSDVCYKFYIRTCMHAYIVWKRSRGDFDFLRLE